ncbi:unnamed protein product [Lactuca virosa]|uniref:Uncharacterized protein n=1 Tax=Lactuca virosa TaxID=75947 RepID=A0AAU9PUN6_9ASTR|nr:unnamed protein product [Lactuca virosa]
MVISLSSFDWITSFCLLVNEKQHPLWIFLNFHPYQVAGFCKLLIYGEEICLFSLLIGLLGAKNHGPGILMTIYFAGSKKACIFFDHSADPRRLEHGLNRCASGFPTIFKIIFFSSYNMIVKRLPLVLSVLLQGAIHDLRASRYARFLSGVSRFFISLVCWYKRFQVLFLVSSISGVIGPYLQETKIRCYYPSVHHDNSGFFLYALIFDHGLVDQGYWFVGGEKLSAEILLAYGFRGRKFGSDNIFQRTHNIRFLILMIRSVVNCHFAGYWEAAFCSSCLIGAKYNGAGIFLFDHSAGPRKLEGGFSLCASWSNKKAHMRIGLVHPGLFPATRLLLSIPFCNLAFVDLFSKEASLGKALVKFKKACMWIGPLSFLCGFSMNPFCDLFYGFAQTINNTWRIIVVYISLLVVKSYNPGPRKDVRGLDPSCSWSKKACMWIGTDDLHLQLISIFRCLIGGI